MNRRLAIALSAFVLWTMVTIIGGNLASGGEMSLQDGVTRGIGWTWVLASAFILTVALLQQWHDVGLTRGASLRAWRLVWLPALYIAGALAVAAAAGLPPAGVMGIILVNTLFVGFSEELMFRGVLLQAFRRSVPVWGAVMLTSVAFGAVHSLNVFVTGDLAAALIQSTAAFMSGLVFIALRLRTGSLWPPVILHGLWDFATFLLGAAGAQGGGTQGGGTDVAVVSGWAMFLPVLVVLPNAIYGLWLMRRIGTTHRDPDS